jgi:diguanylate cyclase (GGDEF)-like protein/PAS domain S-box-containing protein
MINKVAHILVVDDAPFIRQLLEQVLQHYGYHITTAENGQQAIELFLQSQPDLILMDTDMPILDGIAACTRIKALPQAKNLPIIMVTAFVEGQWVDRAYAAGATDYVTKPINLDVLRNRIHYILQAKQAEEALFDEKEKAQITLAAICDGVITTNAKGEVEFLNSVAAKLTGWTTDEAYGLPLNQVYALRDENTQQPVEFPLQRCLELGQLVGLSHTVLVHRHHNQQFAIEDSAAPIKDRNGNIIGVVLVFHDVTENRKMTQELAYRAKHDALTGLWNLTEFKTQLHRVLRQTRDSGSEHALLYLDLDKFKIVNDTCGHEAGDQLLKDVALILQNRVKTYTADWSAILARLGGDEFGLLLENCSLKLATELATSLCEQIENYRFFWQSTPSEKNVFTLGVSIGLVRLSNRILNLKSALAMADAACYVAKNAGRNQVRIYREQQPLESQDQNIQWVNLINDNLEQETGFCLFHQSIVPLASANSSANGYRYEVLLRMKDAQGQLVPLGAFFSVATRYNLMSSLDLWVIRHLLMWLQCHPEHLQQLEVAMLNISAQSLNEQNFLPTLRQLIVDAEILANKLCFEIAETTALTNLSGVLHFMTTLKPLGCRFALSKFGSGIASVNLLKILPIEFLKIDGAVVKAMAQDIVDQAVVKAINEIAHLMNLQTIAQSVETAALFEKLKQIQVDYVQGYWLSTPQPLTTTHEVTELLIN